MLKLGIPNEIRTIRPTPFDEAKWGFAIIENSLWQGVPEFLRQLNEHAREFLGYDLPVGLRPVRISSWMVVTVMVTHLLLQKLLNKYSILLVGKRRIYS